MYRENSSAVVVILHDPVVFYIYEKVFSILNQINHSQYNENWYYHPFSISNLVQKDMFYKENKIFIGLYQYKSKIG